MLNDECENDGSDSGSAGTCTFHFRFEESIGLVDNYAGRVRGVRSVSFVTIEIYSINENYSVVSFCINRSRVQRWSTH